MKDEMDHQGPIKLMVVLDISGNVIETTMANLFWRKGRGDDSHSSTDAKCVAGGYA